MRADVATIRTTAPDICTIGFPNLLLNFTFVRAGLDLWKMDILVGITVTYASWRYSDGCILDRNGLLMAGPSPVTRSKRASADRRAVIGALGGACLVP
jgi:hypothetical protein